MIFARLMHLLFSKLRSFTGYWSSADLDSKDLNSLTVLQINHSRTEMLHYGKIDNKERRDFTGNQVL